MPLLNFDLEDARKSSTDLRGLDFRQRFDRGLEFIGIDGKDRFLKINPGFRDEAMVSQKARILALRSQNFYIGNFKLAVLHKKLLPTKTQANSQSYHQKDGNSQLHKARTKLHEIEEHNSRGAHLEVEHALTRLTGSS